MRRPRLLAGLAAAAVGVALIVGLAQAGSGGTASRGGLPSAAAQGSALAGAPAPLAALHAQASTLLDGGQRAFTGRLAALRGYPVVVYKWASWCGPCRAESGLLARTALHEGRRVAFLGLDYDDPVSGARDFLTQYPQSYPSYVDGDGSISQALLASYQPATVFFDRSGRRVLTHQGPYASEAELLADIARYAQA